MRAGNKEPNLDLKVTEGFLEAVTSRKLRLTKKSEGGIWWASRQNNVCVLRELTDSEAEGQCTHKRNMVQANANHTICGGTAK